LTQDGRVYRRTPTTWLQYNITFDRPVRPIFSGRAMPATRPRFAQVASVYGKGSTWVCSGFGPWVVWRVKMLLQLLWLLLLYLHAMIIGSMVDDVQVAALLASSDAIDKASLSMDLTMEPLLLEREFFVFSFDKEDSELLLAFFLADG